MANEKRLIDANALIAYFEEQYNVAMDDPDPVSGYVMSALRCFIEHFKTIPTVDAVEVVHGRWDKYEDDKFIGYDANGRIQYRKVYTYYCGRCGRGTAVKTNYCPNCGAKMDGDGNGN